ncbi:sensor histidine kinase [Mobilicoccus massiliensis]|uniref:sensor histidine kinase n=1 Tax=Mobilicoccus massiliensis TaxID=1522310 RepID=UPI00058B962D|nr:HAMP domain-containing sensor histidine kinase [Mobilicoccus massiliensis]
MKTRQLGGAGDVFRRLRLRLTAIFVAVAVAGLATLVTLLTALDAHFDRGRVDAILRGEASRAAALVYAGSDGRPETEALYGDHVTRQSSGLVLVWKRGAEYHRLFSSGQPIDGDWQAAVDACLADGEENGTVSDLGTLRVAGMPWWLDQADPAPAGCVLAATPRAGPLQADLTPPAVLGSAALLLLLTWIVWWTAGRSLRIAERALDDREQFLATAAHEMRGPLARIRSIAESALTRLPADQPETARDLRTLVATTEGAGRVAANLLLASRIDHAEVPARHEAVRLDELACDAETRIGGIVVDVTEPVWVEGDAMLLEQAITNLVDNARRHGRSEDGTARVMLTVTHRDGCAVVRVADDGPGFPQGVDVLRPYISGATGGNGLGLPLVRWIARRHGAELWLGSAGGEDCLDGAAAELRFPPTEP